MIFNLTNFKNIYVYTFIPKFSYFDKYRIYIITPLGVIYIYIYICKLILIIVICF